MVVSADGNGERLRHPATNEVPGLADLVLAIPQDD